MATKSEASLDLDALHRLKSTEPPVWLAPRADLSETTRAASKKLFSFLRTYTPKSPLDQLLIDGFDAEQIWQQIDLQSLPLLSSLKREVKKFEKNPEEIGRIRKALEGEKKVLEEERKVLGEESDDFDEELDEGLDDEDEDEEEEKKDEEEEEEEEEEEGSETDGEDDGEEEKGKGGGIEDKFLKINELQEYLEEDEAREYGLKADSNNNKKKGGRRVLEDEDDDEGEEDEEDDDELGLFDDDEEEEDEDMQKLEAARYEDFFGGKNKKVPKKKLKSTDGAEEDSGSDDEAVENQKNDNLSTHEKQLKKLKTEIEKMEKANLDPKSWTMQGEVTAAQRPKNSALEVDLDFQHNVRPAPVITEEFTASLEEMIRKRVIEGQFDDVQKAPTVPSKAPRELKELDENKSKKGLAEVYEEEYAQKTNLSAAPLSFSDERKKEASMLFKKLCLKLDALSHFHFSPKPVIEDMSIQANVPALAMEEIAPIAVSDAAMLAPEEIFAGKGEIKEEAELTQAERKRRRANKKRRFKAEAEKRTAAKKARDNTLQNHTDGKEE